MSVSGLKQIDLNDPLQGPIRLLIPIPRGGDSWGVLAPIRNTDWGKLITVIHGVVMSHALHGYATPLMKEIGIDPEYRARRAPKPENMCLNHKLGCPIAGSHCKPGKKTPDCYEPNLPDPHLRYLISLVVLAWREDRYVVVVNGDEFSF